MGEKFSQQKLNDRKVATYHSVALGNADEDRGGRFAALDKPTVTGSTPGSRYPRMPADNPWNKDVLPPEPSLGYSIEDQEPVGEMFERSPASQPEDAGVGGSSTDGTSEVRPAKFLRRF